MYFNARYYQKEVGRFTSCDPIKSVDSTLSMNPYVYCANNPISYTDPTGLSMMQQRAQKDPNDFGGGGSGSFPGWMQGEWKHGFDNGQYAPGENTVGAYSWESWSQDEQDEADLRAIKSAYETWYWLVFEPSLEIAREKAAKDAAWFESIMNEMFDYYDIVLFELYSAGLGCCINAFKKGLTKLV